MSAEDRREAPGEEPRTDGTPETAAEAASADSAAAPAGDPTAQAPTAQTPTDEAGAVDGAPEAPVANTTADTAVDAAAVTAAEEPRTARYEQAAPQGTDGGADPGTEDRPEGRSEGRPEGDAGPVGPAAAHQAPANAGAWPRPGESQWNMHAQGGHPYGHPPGHPPGHDVQGGHYAGGSYSGGHYAVAGASGARSGPYTGPQYAAAPDAGAQHMGPQHTAPQPGIGGGGGAAPPSWPGAVPPPGGGDGGGAGGPGNAGGKRKRPGPVAVAAATALVTSLIVGPAAAVATTYLTGGSSTPVSSLTGGTAGSVSTGSVSEVAEKVLPSVVSIEAGGGSGSGVVISSDGQILTNAHVVAGARGDTVTVRFNDGSDAEAKIVGADTVSDIAVLEAQGVSGLTPAPLGDSGKVEVGADVVAIGSPLGLSGTVTSGVVSAVDRPVNTGAADGGGQDRQDPFGLGTPEQGQARTSTVINAIQTDAPINPGNSGGPLINMNGEVIGVNTAIAGTSSGGGQGEPGSIGLGFAIPIDQAKPIAEQLIDGGTADYAAIDATVAADRGGVRIVDTAKGGAAAEAGLKGGDVVTSVGGDEVDGPDALIAKIRSKQPGDTVTLGYTRDGKEGEAEVMLAAQSADSIGG